MSFETGSTMPSTTPFRMGRNHLGAPERRRGITSLREACDAIRLMERQEDGPILLAAVVEHGRPPVAVETSLAREVLFALQHTIHHQAIIALLLHHDGVATPSRFGYAPATPTAREA